MNTFARIRRFFVSLNRPYPSRDWFFALALLALALLSFTLFASYLFFGIESGSIITSSAALPPASKALTRGDIQKTLNAYRARRLNYDANNFPAIPASDPAGSFGSGQANTNKDSQ